MSTTPDRLLADAYVEAICHVIGNGHLYPGVPAHEVGSRLWAAITVEAFSAPEADLFKLTKAALGSLSMKSAQEPSVT